MSNVPPPPPPLLPSHDRILGVMFESTLTQAREPARRFTFVRCCGSLTASISHGLAAYRQQSCPFVQLLSLAVASDRPRKGLSPSITQSCPAHLQSGCALLPFRPHPAIPAHDVLSSPWSYLLALYSNKTGGVCLTYIGTEGTAIPNSSKS